MKRPLESLIMLTCSVFTLMYYGGSCVAPPIPCEDRDEPTSIVHFTESEPNYQNVYALNTSVVWSGEFDFIEEGNYQGWVKALPVSLVADTTIYVFEGARHIDTLAFTYTRDVRFESVDCGFTVTLHDFELLTQSTFSDVSFITHTGTGSHASRPKGLTTNEVNRSRFRYGNNIYQIKINN
ncbi:MAG: DUF6452 family protein [Saprospiraceae bacterium]|nr:DUF6452 family protein [Saprospiraceae bacterium]